MSLRHTSVVEHPIDEVFAWHGRKDAIKRLTPPWQPVRVRAGATSLRDGRAVLGLPGGLRWVATHQPDGYSPPHRFVDQLTSLPLSAILSWRHTHEFEATDDTTTRVTDTVDTDLPGAVLRAMFTYRHAQLADDLASHARALAWRSSPVTVAVTGSSGLVGNALTALLSTGGHRVVRLVRRPARAPDEREWDPRDPAPDLLAGLDAVVHLAGDPLPGRPVNAHEASVPDVRACPTRLLAQRAANTPRGPSAFVSASAVGYYGAGNGDEILTEASPRGDGMLAETVAARETATSPAAEAGLRTVNVRSGLVQSPRGGTLRPLFPLFYAGLGASVGEGDRWLPWIGLDDLTDVYLRAILDADLSGPINATAPHPVRNGEYTRALARALDRPAPIPVPGLGPRLLFGKRGSRELACTDQRVRPDRLQRSDHRFRHPDLEAALRHVLGNPLRSEGGA